MRWDSCSSLRKVCGLTIRRRVVQTFLLAWNPGIWPWHDLPEMADKVRRGGSADRWWRCVSHRKAQPSHRVFLTAGGGASIRAVGAAFVAARGGGDGDGPRQPTEQKVGLSRELLVVARQTRSTSCELLSVPPWSPRHRAGPLPASAHRRFRDRPRKTAERLAGGCGPRPTLPAGCRPEPDFLFRWLSRANIDWEHGADEHGPKYPHIGYKTPGKGKAQEVGHIRVDEVPYNRSPRNAPYKDRLLP